MSNSVINNVPNIVESISGVQFKVKRFILKVSNEYNAYYLRPYQFNATADTLTELEAIIMEKGVNHIQSNDFTINKGILKPSNKPTERIDLPEGWNTQRYMFLLEIYAKYISSTEKLIIVQGYTNYVDTSYSGYLDEHNMVFYINSVATKIIRHNSRGSTISILSAPSNVITGEPDKEQYLLTPEAVYNGLDEVDILNTVNALDESKDVNIISSNSLKMVPKQAKKLNNHHGYYMKQLLDSAIKSKMDDSISFFNTGGIYNNAAEYISEPVLSQNVFIKALAKVQNKIVTDNFTLMDLAKLDNTYTENMHILSRQDNFGQSEYWVGEDITTYFANLCLTNIPIFMASNHIINVDFTATNLQVNRVTRELDIQFIPTNYALDPIINPNQAELILNKFFEDLKIYLFNDFTNNNEILFDIRASISVVADSYIEVSIEQEPHVRYVLPTFADARFSPVIMPNRDIYENNLYSFKTIMDNVITDINNNSMHTTSKKFEEDNIDHNIDNLEI